MSDQPENSGKSEPTKPPAGPWIYSGTPEGGFYAPPPPLPPASIPPAAAPAVPPSPAAAPRHMPAHAAAASMPPTAGKPAIRPAGKPPEKEKDTSLANVIDTIEAIIIALIIALSFRAFIVEAFVIPTGSMAPTLLGAHFKAVCPKCGYEFDLEGKVGFQKQKDGANHKFIPIVPDRTAELRDNLAVPVNPQNEGLLVSCPNCRYHIPVEKLPQFIEVAKEMLYSDGTKKPTAFAWANNGDRILVLKYLYAVTEPQRWDVIVFKEPETAQTNYIKRCIGLPTETIQIVGGDVFVGSSAAAKDDPKLRQIARKPEELQQSLWQLVFDNDFYPVDAGADWSSPWQTAPEAQELWKKGPMIRYEGKEPSALTFNLFPSRVNAEVPYTLNTLGYNGDFLPREDGEATPRSLVGDLRLETVWTPADSAAAGIQLTLGRPNNCYKVTWDSKGLALAKFHPATQAFENLATSAGAVLPAPGGGGSYRLSFNNVDHAIQFLIDGKKVLAYAEPWDAAQAMEDLNKNPADWPNLGLDVDRKQRANTLIRVEVAGPCTMSHLKLFRDLYYTEISQGPGTGTLENPITLGENEFFALGDNSRRSADGRMWSKVTDPLGDLALRPGIVPRRYLLGKAFFVYWPAGFRASDKLPLLKNIPLVPNTGDMRIIR